MSTVSDTPFGTALRFDAVDLVGRTGSHRHVERTLPPPPSMSSDPRCRSPRTRRSPSSWSWNRWSRASTPMAP